MPGAAAAIAAALALVAVQAGLGRAAVRDPGSPAWAHASDGYAPPGVAPPRSPETGASSSTWLEGIDSPIGTGRSTGRRSPRPERSFAFIKATDGRTDVDPMYRQNRRGAKAAGLAIGAYHFARPYSTPGEALVEADHFVDVAAIGAGDIIPVLDDERGAGTSTDDLGSPGPRPSCMR